MKNNKILKNALKRKFNNNEYLNQEDKNLVFSNNNVFNEKVEKLSTFSYMLSSLKDFFVKLGLFIWDWLITIVKALLNIFVTIYKIIRYGIFIIYKFFKDLFHKFKYNDWAGRLSYIIFGTGSLRHGQIVNGLLYLIFEIGYIIFFILSGAQILTGVWDLGHNSIDPSWIYTETSTIISFNTVNSLTRLIYGLFILLSLFLFIYIWYRSIISGYNNYRISKFNEYKYIYEKNMDLSEHIDSLLKDKYSDFNKERLAWLQESLSFEDGDFNKISKEYINSLKKSNITKKDIKDETNEELNNLIKQLENEISDQKLLRFYKSYTLYLYKTSINESFEYYKTLQRNYITEEKDKIDYYYILEKHNDYNNNYKNLYIKFSDSFKNVDEFIKSRYDELNKDYLLLLNENLLDENKTKKEVFKEYIKSLRKINISPQDINEILNSKIDVLNESLENENEDENVKKFYLELSKKLSKQFINESLRQLKEYLNQYIGKIYDYFEEHDDLVYEDICSLYHEHYLAYEVSHKDKLDAILLKQKKKEHVYLDKYNNIEKIISEKEKVHSSTGARLLRINYNSYSKFNEYFSKLSKYELELKFYKNYQDINNYYHNIGSNFETANSDNVSLKEQTSITFKEKYDAIVVRYDETFNKKNDILKSIEEQKSLLKEALKSLKIEYKEKQANTTDKVEKQNLKEEYKERKFNLINEYTTRINKLDGQYNSFASDKLLKTLRKEELKLVSKRNKDDLKYIKTNYTNDSYSKEETINYMMLTYDFDYKFSKKVLSIIKLDLSTEQVNEKIESLTSSENDYKSKNESTRFVGKSKSFIDQIKSLFNDKFHITILTLPIIGATIVCIIPLLFSILIAFTNYDRSHMLNVTPFEWTGFDTFIKMFSGSDPIYGQIGSAIGVTFTWTLVWAIFATFSNYFLGIIIALMINKDGIKLKKLWRTIFVLTIAIPQFISLGSLAKMLDAGGTGVLDNLIRAINGSRESILKFATSSENNALGTKIIIIIVNIWVGVPYTILSTTGILMNIPKDLYESSRIDGAGPATQFFKITMPYILFVTGPSLITSFIGNFNNFGVIYFLTGGAPARNSSGTSIAPGYTDLFITYIYTLVTDTNRMYYNVASALGIIIFIICSFISIILYNKTGAVSKEDQFQ